MKFLVRIILYALAVLITAHILPGVYVESVMMAVIVAGVLTLLNVLVKPLLVVLTIPITVVTFGLFLLVINALIILLTDFLVGGFEVDSFWWALIFSLILSLINSIFFKLSGEEKK